MSKRKTKTLREKINHVIYNFEEDEYTENGLRKMLDHTMRIIREEQGRKCVECLRVKNMIDAQIKKNNENKNT